MKIRLNFRGEVTDHNVSKCLQVEDLRKLVFEDFNIAPERQQMFYAGKVLADGQDLQDYKVNTGHTIQVMERAVPKEKSVSSEDSSEASKSDDSETPMEEIDPDSGVDSPTPGGSTSGSEGIGTASTTTQSLEEIRRICPELAAEMERGTAGAEGEAAEPDPPCNKCKGNARRKCKECGCSRCGGKEDPETQLFCEECQYVTHMACLNPPLEKIPEGDWYCPDCKNDADEVISAGQKVRVTKKTAKMPSMQAKLNNKKIRDWGKGEGCTGRRKECTKVGPYHFGPIPGIEVGMTWESRMQLSEEGIHRPPVAGIAGKPDLGSPSLVLAGGYEDDVDNGVEFFYTGAGGRDLSNNKRTGAACEDQKFDKVNKALAVCCAAPINAQGGKAKDWTKGKAIRVSRSYKLKKHSEYAPAEGYRYDGIYKVVKYWQQKSDAHGFKVYRYLLRRDDAEKAPWEKGAKKFRMIKKEVDESKAKKRKADSENIDPQANKKIKPEDKDIVESYEVDADTLALIAKDEKNAQLWKDCLQVEFKTKLDWTDAVEEYLVCTVCLDFLKNPITTDCSHNMCQECYKRTLKFEKRCPSCRKDMAGDLEINAECNNALKHIFK